MNLMSFGCSFIFGTDLSDDGRDLPIPTASSLTWPALIAKQLGMDYHCHARGGQGNLFILEQLLCEIDRYQDAFVVVGWTWIDRFDYINCEQNRWIDWKALRPSMHDDVSNIYFKHINSQYRDQLTSLIYMQTAIDLLDRKGVPYIMTCMDELIFDRRWNTTPAITNLQNYVQPCMSTFNGNNFLHWAKINNFEISPTWHPLEAAHAAAAEIMMPIAQSLV